MDSLDINSFLLGILAALIPMILGHFLTKSRTIETSNTLRLHAASDKLKAAIATELAILTSKYLDDRRIIIKSKDVDIATLEYKTLLKGNDLTAFTDLRDKYHAHKKNKNYFDDSFYVEALEQIKAILKFVEERDK